MKSSATETNLSKIWDEKQYVMNKLSRFYISPGSASTMLKMAFKNVPAMISKAKNNKISESEELIFRSQLATSIS